MLKTTESLNKLTLNKNDGSRSASSKNDNSRLASEKNNGNSKVDEFGVGKNGVEYAKKSGKLSKSGKSKSKKTSKSRNLAKSGKKLSKSGNSINSNATEDRSKFLTPNAKTAFNRLWLTFTEAPIFWHFDSKCHI